MLLNSPQTFATSHVSQLKAHFANDDVLFQGVTPGLVMMVDGLEEYFIDKIVDVRSCGHSWQYLICWVGYRLEEDCWLSGTDVADCDALDV